MSMAMLTSLSGMLANQTALDVLANNLANVDTNGFKASRIDFSDQLYDARRSGTAPGGARGGTDPQQVGHGVEVGSVQVSFSQGGVNPTGRDLDLAITGEGFFRLQRSDGNEVYSRVGSFGFDSGLNGSQHLVDLSSGAQVLNTNGQPISLVTNTPAAATTGLALGGNLAPTDLKPLQGESLRSLFDLRRSDGKAVNLNTPLSSLTLAHGVPGAITLNLAGTETDGTGYQRTVQLAAGATVQDLVSALDTALTKAVPIPANPTQTTTESLAKVTLDGSALLVTAASAGLGSGTASQFSLFLGEGAAPAAGATVAQLHAWQHSANGSYTWDQARFVPSSVSTTMKLFTADGTSHELSGRWYASGATATGERSWDLQVEPPSDGTLISGGLQGLTFNPDGTLKTAPAGSLQSTWTVGGASTIALDATTLTGQQLASAVDAEDSTGYPAGTLEGTTIRYDGVVIGAYSNGRSVPMSATDHQVGLVTFANPGGLINLGGNAWDVGVNSGNPLAVVAGNQGTNRISGGALEGSNVDLASEFSRLVVTQRAFQSNSKSFQVADEMLKTANELVR